MMRKSLWMVAATAVAPGLTILTAHAQSGRDLHRAVDAAILSDISAQRQAERDARRQPYIPVTVQGSIRSADAARDACAGKALHQAGRDAVVLGRPSAQTMSTGWEVEGEVGYRGDSGAVPFVCSVRNGSVTGILLRR